MFADLLGRCRSRRRAVDHGCVAVDGGRLAGDRRRDHVDVENSAVGKETTDGELIDLTEPPPRSITNGPPYHFVLDPRCAPSAALINLPEPQHAPPLRSSVPLRTTPSMRAICRARRQHARLFNSPGSALKFVDTLGSAVYSTSSAASSTTSPFCVFRTRRYLSATQPCNRPACAFRAAVHQPLPSAWTSASKSFSARRAVHKHGKKS